MNHLPQNSEHERKAAEALITAALHQDKSEVDPVIIAKYMAGNFSLSSEEKASIEKIGDASLDPSLEIESNDPLRTELAESEAFAALHRQNAKGDYSQETKDELERKRKELREKLRRNIEKDKK